MKIAYCIPSCHKSGGMERVLSLKANYLSDVLGWEIIIITTEKAESSPAFPLSSAIRVLNLKIGYDDDSYLNFLERITDRLGKKKQHRRILEETLKREQCDICVSMFCHEMSFLADLNDGSKKVLELHFCKDFRQMDCLYNKKGVIRKFLGHLQNWNERRKIKKYDSFVVLTQEDAQAWGKTYNTSVIANPLSFSVEKTADYSAHHAVAVGRLCPQKGFDLLIEAWALLPEDLKKEWDLTIYGNGGDKESLNKLIANNQLENSIRIHEPVKNIQNHLIRNSLFCFSSRYEGFGMALIEAMSCGLSCISFACPCGPKDLISHGVDGMLVEHLSVHKMALEIQKLMENEERRRMLGENAQSTIKKQYSLDAIMNQWIKLFQELGK